MAGILQAFNCVGECPVCGSAKLNYYAMEVHDDQLEYAFTCINCGQQGSEWFTLNYVETIVYKDDDDE